MTLSASYFVLLPFLPPPKHSNLHSLRLNLNLFTAFLEACFFFLQLAERELSIKILFSLRRKLCPVFLVVFVADMKRLKTKCTFESFRLKQMRAVYRQMEKGSQGSFQLWDRTYHFSKLLLASVFAWGSSVAPHNPLRVPGLAVLFGCWSVTSQQLNNCYKAAITEETLLRDELIYLSFLHYCQKSTGLIHEICPVLMFMIRSKRSLCQCFTLLSKVINKSASW